MNSAMASPAGKKIGHAAAVIQARLGSQRLAGKALRLIAGKPLLQHVIERIRLAQMIDDVYVATTSQPADDAIENFCRPLDVEVYRGSTADVLGRMRNAAHAFNIDSLVRITADSPLIDPEIVDFVLARHLAARNDLTTTYHSKTFPGGTILSVIEYPALEYLASTATRPDVREHLITDLDSLHAGGYRVEVLDAPPCWRRPEVKLSVDYLEDLLLVEEIIRHCQERGLMPSLVDVIALLDKQPELAAFNHNRSAAGY